MFLAEDIMTSPTMSIDKDKNVKEALDLLAENDISGMPVTDEKGKLAGIISGADIMRYSQMKNLVSFSNTSLWVTPFGKTDDYLQKIHSGYENLHRTLVEQIMTKKVHTAFKDTPISDIAQLMSQHKINRIPIVDADNKVICIVTRNGRSRILSIETSG
ncbi:MAG: CBS domain-containing protein [Bacillota bacterium]